MDLSARSQFCAICYRQTSIRIGHAVAKASVMRLLAEFLVYLCPSSFPLMPLLRIALARQILSLLLFISHVLLPLAPSPLLRPYPLPLPLLRNTFLFLDALSFLLSRALLAFTLS
jgi:hypothetical protein